MASGVDRRAEGDRTVRHRCCVAVGVHADALLETASTAMANAEQSKYRLNSMAVVEYFVYYDEPLSRPCWMIMIE